MHDYHKNPAAIAALTRLNTPNLGGVFVKQLEDPDFAVRAAAAEALGKLKPEGAAQALREAYKRGVSDSTYGARTAALAALTGYGAGEAAETLHAALQDKDWAVRIRADELLAQVEPNGAPREMHFECR